MGKFYSSQEERFGVMGFSRATFRDGNEIQGNEGYEALRKRWQNQGVSTNEAKEKISTVTYRDRRDSSHTLTIPWELFCQSGSKKETTFHRTLDYDL